MPVLGGLVADASSLPVALIVPAACYAVVAVFGWTARKPAVADAGPEVVGLTP